MTPEMLSSIGSFVGGLGAAGTGIANSVLSIVNNRYQKDLQNRIFAREDSAIQRRVADAEKAGFNKFSVIGEGSPAGSVVSTTAPEISNISGNTIEAMKAVYQLAHERESAKLVQKENRLMDTQVNDAEWKWQADKWRYVLDIANSMNQLGLPYIVGSDDIDGSPFIQKPNSKDLEDIISQGYSTNLPLFNKHQIDTPGYQKYNNEIEESFARLKKMTSESKSVDIENQIKEFKKEIEGKESKYYWLLQALDFISGLVGFGIYHKF